MSSEIDRLEIKVQSQASKANKDLEKLAARLEMVSASLSKVNTSGLSQLAVGVGQLATSMQSMNTLKTSDFTRLAKNIEKMATVNQAGIQNTANAIRDIANAMTSTASLSEGATQITEFASSISKLGHKSASTAISNIPLMADGLKKLFETLSTVPHVSQNVIQMTNAISQLASHGSRIQTTAKGMTSSMNTYSSSTKQATANTKALAISVATLTAKFWAVRRAVIGMWGSVEKSMDFTETINLFQTSFKKIGMDAAVSYGLEWGSETANQFAIAFIDEAQRFTDKIVNSLSLDPNTIMNYQAMFGQMSNAFGLTDASIMNLSKSFTMLGLDMASLFNSDIATAMKKLQSGLAGEVEPLRAWGIDITEATLKLTAMKYGIEDSITTMSQAAKTQLRWLAIMEQTEVAFGDMAKTIDSPANQLRILQQQWANLSRTLGNVFLPIVTKILPYINGLVIALQRMLGALANAVGFELPNYSDSNIYKDIAGDIGEVGSEAEGAKEFVDKLKKSLLSIDELNILSDQKTKGVDLGSGYSELDDIINSKTGSYLNKFNEELAKSQNTAEAFADSIQPKLEAFVKWLDKISPIIAGIGGAFVTYKVVTWFGSLTTALGALNPTVGVAMLAIGAIAAIYSAVKEYNKKLVEEDLASRFGDITLSLEEIEDVADRITSNEYTAKIDIAIAEKAKLTEIEAKIKTDIDTLNKINWKVKVGLALTEGEVAQYKATIESFINNMNEYIDQQHYVATLAVDAVIQDGKFKTEMSELVDRYFNGSKAEMERLGKQLRSTMDEALADGVLDAEEQKVISSLMKEMAEIQSRIADAKFTAKLQSIAFEGDLTAESYKKLFEEIQGHITERSKQAEDLSLELLTVVNAQYEIDMENATTPEQKAQIKSRYEKDVNGITDELSRTKAEISYNGVTFMTNKLIEKWGVELGNAETSIKELTVNTMNAATINAFAETDPNSAITGFVNLMSADYQLALSESGMDKASRTALEEMLESLKPTEADNLAIYKEALKTGSEIPQGIVDQLTAIETLKMLTGENGIDGMYFVMGQQMASSPELLKLLASSKNAGALLDDNIITGMKSKIPDLKLQGNQLVFNVENAIKTATSSVAPNVKAHAQSTVKAYGKVFANDKSAEEEAKRLAKRVANALSNEDIRLMINVGVNDKTAFGNLKAAYEFQGYATGGFPNTGELFMARENGLTEMVGRIGTKTAVANNDQITEGIASAVKGAIIETLVPMLSSMNNSGGSVVVENRLIVDSEEMWVMSQVGKAKAERRYQTTTRI